MYKYVYIYAYICRNILFAFDNLELNMKEINLIRTYFTFAILQFRLKILCRCPKKNALGTNMSQKHDY